MLLADKLQKDKRVKKARQLLASALADNQKKFTTVQPPQKKLKTSYQLAIKKFSRDRGGPLIFPYLGSGMGRGPLVELADGSVKYDFIAGIGVHYWGHNHPDLLQTGIDAALGDTVMQGHLQQNTDSAALTALILKGANRTGAKLKNVILSTSGAMANENGFKILFQNKSPANRVICFSHCFMGRTLALAQASDKPAYRIGLPKTLAVDYIPPFDYRDPAGSLKKSILALQYLLKKYPGKHAFMCFELVQGEGGFYPGNKKFFTALMTMLKKNNIRILVDEIQTFGRLPGLFAFQYFGLERFVDAVCMGKLSQVCATLYTEKVKPGPGLIAQTFTASTSAIKASHSIISSLLTKGYLGPGGKIQKFHNHAVKRLNGLESKYPGKICGPWGLGVMVAFQVGSGDFEKTKSFVFKLFDNGVMGFMAGSNPTRVRFLIPAGAVTTKDIDAVMNIVDKTLADFTG